MKFQIPSMQVSEVMLCIKKRNTRAHRRTNEPEAICPSNFEVGGITRYVFVKHYAPNHMLAPKGGTSTPYLSKANVHFFP